MKASSNVREKEVAYMNTRFLLLAIAVVAGFTFVAPGAGAWDTSPYLTGTVPSHPYPVSYFIGNPTTKDLRVYAVFYGWAGGYQNICYYKDMAPNTMWHLWDEALEWSSSGPGTVKFFAFPAATIKFDPNAVIGGFQQGAIPPIVQPVDPSNVTRCTVTEANLKAVTINSLTIGEFGQIPFGDCSPWPPLIQPCVPSIFLCQRENAT
jgi:hypothetical protein